MLVFIFAEDFVREERFLKASSAMTHLRYPLCAIALVAGLGQAAVAADAGVCAQVKNPGARDLCLAARGGLRPSMTLVRRSRFTDT